MPPEAGPIPDKHLDIFARLFRVKGPFVGHVSELVIDSLTFVMCPLAVRRSRTADASSTASEDVTSEPIWSEPELAPLWDDEDAERLDQAASSAPGQPGSVGSSRIAPWSPRPSAPIVRDLAMINLMIVVDHTGESSRPTRAAFLPAVRDAVRRVCTLLVMEEERTGFVTSEVRLIARARDEARLAATAAAATSSTNVTSAGFLSPQRSTTHSGPTDHSPGADLTAGPGTAAVPGPSVASVLPLTRRSDSAAIESAGTTTTTGGGGGGGSGGIAVSGDMSASSAGSVAGLASSHIEAWLTSRVSTASDLARTLIGMYEGLSVWGEGEAHLRINQWLHVSVSASYQQEHERGMVVQLGPAARVRPYHALLLLDPVDVTLASLPADASFQLRELVRNASPLVTLQHLQLRTAIDEQQLLHLAEHLVAWGRARVLPVITQQTCYAVAPSSFSSPLRDSRVPVHVAPGSELAAAFARDFHDTLGSDAVLAQALSFLSGPKPLKVLTEQVPAAFQPFVCDILIWLLRRGLVAQVCKSIMYVPIVTFDAPATDLPPAHEDDDDDNDDDDGKLAERNEASESSDVDEQAAPSSPPAVWASATSPQAGWAPDRLEELERRQLEVLAERKFGERTAFSRLELMPWVHRTAALCREPCLEEELLWRLGLPRASLQTLIKELPDVFIECSSLV